MQRHSLCQIVGSILIGMGSATLPVAAEIEALPPLADEIAAQFPAIGRLGHGGFRTQQGCTATLIAPNLIVTAAHCVAETGHSGRVFVAGWSRGDYIAARDSKREMRHPAYALDGTHHPRNDVALVVLDSPIDDVTPIPLGRVEEGGLHGTEVALIGYHRKTPHLLSGDFNCAATQFAVGLVYVGCPVINGNSGGPVLRENKDGAWQVVGVVSSQRGGGAIAVELPIWLRREVAAHLRR
ncbi:serine protease [Puniceibacterium sp. IMCC21224]|uniref:trypsin-like serine peptidase n=1 Tax=Puniceibacterium sp. IMCC21224 TaxID=1618204 RepID=UPI00064DA24C|nr:trypsin-like serine protease [Puniceibacterium sp. IMCC21224]KMK68507.1 Trypsin [Puniceibacterium sp. IMCC21224]